MTATAGATGDGGKQGFDEAYRALVEDGRLQTEMDRFQPAPQREPPDMSWFDWLSGTGSFWEGLFWVLAAGIVLTLLYFIGRWALRAYAERSRDAGDEEEAEADWRPEAGPARALLARADDLAREGRFAEAVHLLLFRSLEHIEERLPDFLRPALTSRDIAGAEALPSPARGAFSTIARVVERGVFAARPVDESGWSEARTAYERFAFGESWR